MKIPYILPIFILLITVAFFIGRNSNNGTGISHEGHNHSGGEEQSVRWSCAMHPQIQKSGPGKCPICGMDLVPLSKSGDETLKPNQIKLSESALQIAQVRTTPVIRDIPTVEVPMVGKVDFDETRLSYISSRFPGRLERLFVDYTGVLVKKGDHLVEIYSPDLLAAQEELLQAIETANDLKDSPNEQIRARAQETIQAAREKLLLWNLQPEQVAAIEKKGETSDRLTLNAPTGGIVIRKEAVEGKYVETGALIYTIADLSRVWVVLDAYESDLVWLHYGQEVEFTSKAYPGEIFVGRISFIDPVLNPKTRTVRIRVNMDNSTGKLKPEMFVNAVVRSRVASGGKVMSPSLAGKWISPMHPEIVRDEAGDCPVCGMALVSAKSLGYLPANVNEKDKPLVIPVTAPLMTGKRAVVYVAVKDQPGVFEGRVIELGPRAKDLYIVKSGLIEGELVVFNGAFKIDSAVQIMAKPSMMNPMSDQADPSIVVHAAPEQFMNQIGVLMTAYFPVTDALSHDDQTKAINELESLSTALKKVDRALLKGNAHMDWMKHAERINKGIEAMKSASDVKLSRVAFEDVSEGLLGAVEGFGIQFENPVYVYHCPMAVGGKGANWLQNKQGTENPYFGSSMFSCGDEVRVVGSTLKSESGEHGGHQHGEAK
ncbi:efflux RND transporter periplasmic adaptor subunit [bacterium]|nr:efflux RND transporter periplasmic adaptor subunit [bacterium]